MIKLCNFRRVCTIELKTYLLNLLMDAFLFHSKIQVLDANPGFGTTDPTNHCHSMPLSRNISLDGGTYY